MCRNIKTLHNFEPPATTDEVSAAALQYVRKVSGVDEAVEGERGGLRARRRRGRRTRPALLAGARDGRAAARPRGRGRSRSRPRREALRPRRLGALATAVEVARRLADTQLRRRRFPFAAPAAARTCLQLRHEKVLIGTPSGVLGAGVARARDRR